MTKKWMDVFSSVLMPLLPKHDLSHWTGRALHKNLPGPLAQKSVELFAKLYDINTEEAELPLSSYASVGEFFSRKLRSGARPIGVSPVHPADALITECGPIEKLQALQVKGKYYSIPELLRSSRESLKYEQGHYITYYLSPKDYHRVHSPVSGQIHSSCHIPGSLWPVNPWSVSNIQNLFSINERIAVHMNCGGKNVAVVLVAATNVGNMTLSFDESIRTNLRDHREHAVKPRIYQPEIHIDAGAELGVFHMGSTVVLLLEKGMVSEVEHLRGRDVKMGQSIASFLS